MHHSLVVLAGCIQVLIRCILVFMACSSRNQNDRIPIFSYDHNSEVTASPFWNCPRQNIWADGRCDSRAGGTATLDRPVWLCSASSRWLQCSSWWISSASYLFYTFYALLCILFTFPAHHSADMVFSQTNDYILITKHCHPFHLIFKNQLFHASDIITSDKWAWASSYNIPMPNERC